MARRTTELPREPVTCLDCGFSFETLAIKPVCRKCKSKRIQWDSTGQKMHVDVRRQTNHDLFV